MSERQISKEQEGRQPEGLPPELEGKTIPRAEGADAAGVAEGVVARDAGRPGVADPEVAAAFAADIHSYVREYIALADQKAGLLFTVLAGTLAYLQMQGATRRWLVPLEKWTTVDGLSFVAVVGLVLGATAALIVVVPRKRASVDGLVFWGSIARCGGPQEYADRVAVQSAAALIRAKLEHCHELAAVCQRKYQVLDGAIWLGGIGLWAAVAYVAMAAPSP